MSKIVWDQTGQKTYEAGVNKGVIFPQVSTGLYPKGTAWNGLTTVTESPSGAEAKKSYADNLAYCNIPSAEEFAGTIEAYTYPNEFGICDGSAELAAGVKIGQQKRKAFGLAYVTMIGNDIDGLDHGYKIHIIYGAMAAPSEKAYASSSDSTEPIAFSWALTTTPVAVPGFKPTATLTIDSTTVARANLDALELILYGNTGVDPRLPLPDEIASIFGGSVPSALSLVTSAPAAEATAVAVGSSVVLTFNNKISTQAITVSSQDGAKVTGTYSFDETGKIYTFHPTVALTAATTYLVVISGVTDIYSNALDTVINKFTTA